MTIPYQVFYPGLSEAEILARQAEVVAELRDQRGRFRTALSLVEMLRDMRAHGREINKTPESARAFLQRAGIVDENGELAEPYRQDESE